MSRRASAGGNDAGFSDDLQTCYTAELPGHGHERDCVRQGAKIDGEIAQIGPRLTADLRAIRARAPNARIIIETYPRPFPENAIRTGACLKDGWGVATYHLCLSPGDQRFLNAEAAKLDNAICSAVQHASVGAECVNAYDAFAGCEMGEANSCLQSPTLHISGTTVVGVDPGAFHPTAGGQQLMGRLIEEEISNPPPPGGH